MPVFVFKLLPTSLISTLPSAAFGISGRQFLIAALLSKTFVGIIILWQLGKILARGLEQCIWIPELRFESHGSQALF